MSLFKKEKSHMKRKTASLTDMCCLSNLFFFNNLFMQMKANKQRTELVESLNKQREEHLNRNIT